MKVLVTGGAGYIGSHVCLRLMEAGYEPVAFDNLAAGHAEAALGWELMKGDVGDESALREVFARHRFDAVMHFAAFAYVGESVTSPEKYFDNNLARGLTLLKVMREFSLSKMIFSSSCAVYGNAQTSTISEGHPENPVNPYGESKLFFEKILRRYKDAYGFQSISFRYFNAAGADPEGRLGESHDPETHLIPLLLQVAKGERPHFNIYGDDYDTKDGTCVRDFVHVCDIADAHIKGLELFDAEGAPPFFNLGSGQGYSVAEVADAVRRITGRKVEVRVAGRRAGDPPRLVADASLAEKELGWRPRFREIESIIESAWRWELSRRF